MKRVFLVVPLMLMNVGCYFGANALPKVTNEQLKSNTVKPSIAFDVRITQFKRQDNVTQGLPQLQKHTEKVLLKSNMFSSVVMNDSTPVDYRFHLRFAAIPDRNDTMTGGQFANAVITGLTFFFFPLYVSDPIDFYAEVEKDGAIIKKYQYREKAEMFVCTIAGVVGFLFVAGPAAEECEANTIRNFLLDMKKDFLATPPTVLEKSATGS